MDISVKRFIENVEHYLYCSSIEYQILIGQRPERRVGSDRRAQPHQVRVGKDARGINDRRFFPDRKIRVLVRNESL